MKYKILQRPAMLMLACLLSPLNVHTTELEPYTDEVIKSFTLTDINLETHSLTDYHGKVVLVNFWASWCMPCVKEMPELTQLKQHMVRQSFEILTINVGEHEKRVKHFVKRTNFNLPVLLDTSSKVFNEWNIKIMPSSFLIDASGFVRYRVTGNPGWDDEQILSLIESLIKETEKPEHSKQ